MKKLIYSKEDLDLILTLELEEKEIEIERLNNIINELEKYHKIQMGIASDVRDNLYCLGRYDSSYDSFQRIQELKGSDKEWLIKS